MKMFFLMRCSVSPKSHENKGFINFHLAPDCSFPHSSSLPVTVEMKRTPSLGGDKATVEACHEATVELSPSENTSEHRDFYRCLTNFIGTLMVI